MVLSWSRRHRGEPSEHPVHNVTLNHEAAGVIAERNAIRGRF